jgi:hypothetical protein
LEQTSVGDRVYIWIAGADNESKSGIFAEAVISSPIRSMASGAIGSEFWPDEDEEQIDAPRVWLTIIKISDKREQILNQWLDDDPILSSIPALVQVADGYLDLPGKEAARLAQMWARVGQHWSRSESLAGLWAYVETLQIPISKLPGSPVATVSLITGRAVTGVYNKVMNFRSIDPRDPRKGMDGAGLTDRKVWEEFFDSETQVLNEAAVRAEFARLWETTQSAKVLAPDAMALEEAIDRQADALSNRSYEDLILKYETQKELITDDARPSARAAKRTVFERNPWVIAIAKTRANFECEVPGCTHSNFIGRNHKPYCEVHHIQPLAEGGFDTIENVVCLCPSHHREAHFGEDKDAVKRVFSALRND